MNARLTVSRTVAAAVLLVVMAACTDNSDQASTEGTTAVGAVSVPLTAEARTAEA
ncbi:hypothetical protein G6048_25035, partial [Streptomyces sp. YC419]|nr:hypothetical protein [Streptomyces ureilyticus]